MTKKKLRGRKLLTYNALVASLGNITVATKQAGIERCTHYEWLKKDSNYKEWCDDLPDIEVNFYESALRKLIKNGDTKATVFALKSKGKGNGWVERSEVEHSGVVIVSDEDLARRRVEVQDHIDKVLNGEK